MASEDVIELGSSEEESEPAPKKIKTTPKPNPRPMVYIPNNLREVTIKPAKSNVLGKHRKVTVTKQIAPRHIVANPFANKIKSNGIEIKTFTPNDGVPKPVNSIGSTPRLIPSQPRLAKVIKVCNPFRMNAPQNISKLPPDLIVRKTTASNVKQKLNIPVKSTYLKNAGQVRPIINVNKLLSVHIDTQPSTAASTNSGHQWYLRPEDQKDTSTEDTKTNEEENKDAQSKELEKQNNKEPETNFIEITIDDSPIKLKSKRTCEVQSELAITIDDSPVKNTENTGSDNSDTENTDKKKERNSKKKLDYPKNNDNSIEIEIEPIVTNKPVNENKGEEDSNIHVIEIDASPAKLDNFEASTPKKSKTKNQNSQPHLKEFGEVSKVKGEFHPVYEDFINLCRKLENSDDMNKIIERKIKGYYRQVPIDYTESETFIDMVNSKITAMQACPEKMYLYIKDVVDELNLQRKMAKAEVAEVNANKEEQEKYLYGEESEFDSKRQRQIRKLEKTIKKLHRAIQKLEEQEVDFDDEDDSVYLLTERYKERMVRVHAKLCQLTNTKMPSEPRVHIEPRPGHPKGPAKRIEKWINKKVPIGTPLPFPDFHDVLRCVRDANQEDNLGWNEVDVMEEARDLFVRCGKKLQRRRQENEWRLAASRIATAVDPAEEDIELKKKLDDNKKDASKKEAEVFNKYADRQNQLNLEAVEISDNEAEKSPDESDDDDPGEEDSALADKEIRKNRIKRLIQEKSNKVSVKEKDDSKEKEESMNSENISKDNSVEKSDKLADSEPQDANTKANNIEEEPHCSKTITNEAENKDKGNDSDKIHSLSDDSNDLDSDIDELHLLQKLHSEKEENSQSSSDIETSYSSNISNDNNDRDSDVISIENSSYSEPENNIDDAFNNDFGETFKDNEKELVSKEPELETIMETETLSSGDESKDATDVINKTNNDEFNESIEDILLASSDEETEKNKETQDKTLTTNIDIDVPEQITEKEDTQDSQTGLVNDNSKPDSINLRDDSISIGETLVGEHQKDNDEKESTINKSITKTNSIEAMDTDTVIESNIEKDELVAKVSEETKTDAVEKDIVSDVLEVSNTEKNKNGDVNSTEPMSVDT